MIKVSKLICMLGLCAQSTYSFSTEAKVANSLQSEWLHYLLFDLVFIASIWLLYTLCKLIFSYRKKKENKNLSLNS